MATTGAKTTKKPASTGSPAKKSTADAPADSPVVVGKPAPAFSLVNAAGEKRTLRSYAGRWLVLYFYPRDDTPGCTTEACEFTSSFDDFAGLDAAVVGVSPDTPEKHAKFTAKYELRVELLADPEKTALGAYGAYGKKMFYGKEIVGVLRQTVIIDPKGKVAHHFKSVKAAGHAAAVAQTLRELQAA